MGGVKPQIWCPNFRRWGGLEKFGQNPYFILFASCCRFEAKCCCILKINGTSIWQYLNKRRGYKPQILSLKKNKLGKGSKIKFKGNKSIGWKSTLRRLEGSGHSMKRNMKFQSCVKCPKSWKYEEIYISQHCVYIPLASPTHRGLCMLFIQEQYIGCQTLSLVHYNRNGVDIFQFEVIIRLIYFSDQL